MDIVKNEICKLLTKRTVLILLFLLVLNPVLGLYTMNTVNDDGYTGKDYSALYGEISNYSREDVLPEIEQKLTAGLVCAAGYTRKHWHVFLMMSIWTLSMKRLTRFRL